MLRKGSSEDMANPENLKRQFEEDTANVAEQTVLFLQTMHPASKRRTCFLRC